MAALLIVFGVPVIFAGLSLSGKLEKAWIFFCTSVLSFYLAFGMLSVTLPLAEKLVGANSNYLFLLAFTAAGLTANLILFILFSLILTGKKIEFPERICGILQFVLVYCGSLLMVVLLTIGTAPFLASAAPEMTAGLMKTVSMIVPRTMNLCQRSMTTHQTQWLRYAAVPVKALPAEPPAEKIEPPAKK